MPLIKCNKRRTQTAEHTHTHTHTQREAPALNATTALLVVSVRVCVCVRVLCVFINRLLYLLTTKMIAAQMHLNVPLLQLLQLFLLLLLQLQPCGSLPQTAKSFIIASLGRLKPAKRMLYKFNTVCSSTRCPNKQ